LEQNSILEQNLIDIRRQIGLSALKSGRKPEDITLVGVTKTVGAERVREAAALGLTELGENKVQELLSKFEAVPDVRWHMIGRLQTNKVRYVIDKAVMIHSLDSLRLAREIDGRAAAKSLKMDVLIEVNIGGEPQKGGVPPSELREFADTISEFPALRLRGLMTITPYVENAELSRHFFKKMYQLFVDIERRKRHNVDSAAEAAPLFDTLSMGMTNDFAVAIEEGATMVRIGTGIFGVR